MSMSGMAYDTTTPESWCVLYISGSGSYSRILSRNGWRIATSSASNDMHQYAACIRIPTLLQACILPSDTMTVPFVAPAAMLLLLLQAGKITYVTT